MSAFAPRGLTENVIYAEFGAGGKASCQGTFRVFVTVFVLVTLESLDYCYFFPVMLALAYLSFNVSCCKNC